MKKLLLVGMLAAGLVSGAAVAGTPATSGLTVANTCGMALPSGGHAFTVGTMHVTRYGTKGRPVILIPGLSSGAWVWSNTIRDLRRDHVVYAVTLAGFDGVPMPKQKTHLLDQADASLLKLIETRHLKQPVVVGHSIGGTLAWRFAGEHDALLGGVVAVDGLPVFPGAQNLTSAQRKTRAAGLKAQVAGVMGKQWVAYNVRYMHMDGVRDAAKADCYGQLAARTDPAAMAEYAADDYASDYRPGLAQVTVPALEVVPYDVSRSKLQARMTGDKPMTIQAKKAFYASLLTNARTAKVVIVKPSLHFVMLDQPAQFEHVLDGFLSHLGKK